MNWPALIRRYGCCKYCSVLDLKINIFAGDIFGYFGYSFMDLVQHDYVEEEVKKVEAGEGKKAKEDEPDAKKAKMVRFLTILGKIILLM